MKNRYISIALFLAFILTVLCSNAVARETKVAVFEFDVNSMEDISYIQSGMTALLSTRLTVQGKISVIDYSLIKKDLPGKIKKYSLSQKLTTAKKHGAAFLLTGSITKIGDNISVDSLLIDVLDSDQRFPVFIQSTGFDNIIPEINNLTEKLKKTIIEGPQIPEHIPHKETAEKTEPEKIVPDAVTFRKKAEQSSVKEAPLYDTAKKETVEYKSTQGSLPSATKTGHVFSSAPYFTFHFKGEPMRSLASGDTNGDGNREFLIAGEEKILIWEITETNLKQLNEIKTEVDEYIVRVNAADLNGNNVDEIYVSSYEGHYGNSFVVEYIEEKYKRIADSEKWFFRTYGDTKQGIDLLGQKADITNPFSGVIHKFEWKAGKLIPREEVILPGKSIIYGFTEADIDSDGSKEHICFSKGFFSSTYKMTVLSYTGRVEWTDMDNMGGCPNSFPIDLFDDELEQKELVPFRILCEDINMDNKLDVIVGKNSKKSDGILSKIKSYNQGQVFCLQWDGSDFTVNWSSGLLHDYVADYILEDFDNDGKKELYILSVSEEGFFGKAKNSITGFKQTGI